jgi:uncharacterized protein
MARISGQRRTKMTPQERQLIAELFERLASLENEPRDPAAEQAIREGLSQAPHAIYPLVQSVLVQDEALKQADARIQELEAALQGGAGEREEQRGFLDNMRDTVFGRDEPRGSVPSVRPGDQPMGVPPQYRTGAAPWGGGGQPAQWGGGGQQQPMQGGQQQPMQYEQQPSRGGSFLGTAAAAAAGMIGGGLLLDGIRGMLGGGQHKGPFAGAMDELGSGGSRTPWGGGDLGRQAGLDDIGGRSRAGLFEGEQGGEHDRTAGLFDTAEHEGEFDDTDFGDDSGDSDTA